MPYRLNDDLSFCRIAGTPIFLDIQNDRYFKLSSALENAFLAYLEAGENSNVGVDALVERNILTSAPPTKSGVHAEAIAGPARSALEPMPPPPRLGIASLLDVFVIVCSTRVQLKTRTLGVLLSALATYRSKRVPEASRTSINGSLRASSAIFRRARRYVPVETCCLLDSVSLVKFLAKRGMRANLIFGVMGDPFSAHCWVQAGELVLNDTIGNVYSHTPIRVV